ncbi:MAG TPA: LytTR family DNA-binding domain-containing protein [Bacteroidales bacterium]|nr:LytTR family DNA-binding domain-containing protein [Bacteroidales bacterium]
MELKCIAIDDEPLALEIITAYISKVPFLRLMKTFDNAIDSIDYLRKNKVDLMFLDIEMESLSGIQLIHALKDRPEVIFTTAYDSYAVEGFELDAADYLLKPISFERFVKSVDKVYNKFAPAKGKTDGPSHPARGTGQGNFIFVKTENRLQKVAFSEILYIEGQGDYLKIVTPTARIMTLQNFKKFEETLPKENFIRVHKSYLVALNKIESISRNRIKIGSTLIPVSDSYKDAFFGAISKKGLL